MKKYSLFVLIIKMIICSTILLTSCPNTPRYYVALGDSVASGYGLPTHEESYPAIFYNLLEKEGYVNNYANMAYNGFTTTMLLEYLHNMDIKNIRILENARAITLNIGGNNILVPFFEYLSNLRVVSGTDIIIYGTESVISGAWSFISGVRSGVMSRMSGFDENCNVATVYIMSGINEMKTGAGSIIAGTGEIISGTPDVLSTLNGSFSPVLREDLERGVQLFSVDFIDIIALIKQRAPRATIIVNTIYNPIPQEILGTSLEISNVTNRLIESMNSIIIRESRRGYLVADIHTCLSNQLVDP
jgi:lysophospholipase L1-like esterase